MLTRRHFLFTAAALPLIVGAPIALAADYDVISAPIATIDPKRIEVVELFFYGCPHCFALEPDVVAWTKALPKNVYFRRVPAVFTQTPHWIPLARAFYAAEILGLTDKLHHDFFNAVHLSGQNLNDREVLLKLVQKLGANRKQFEQALDSPEVNKRVAQSQQISNASGAKGVPAFVIDGKFITSVTQTGTPERLFATMNDLITQAQQNKKN